MATDRPEPPGGTASWVSREVEAMAAAAAAGARASAADALARHPEADSEAALRLIYEEVCLAREAGGACATSEVVGRYPRRAGPIRRLLEADRLLGPAGPAPPALPGPGETLGPFRLLAELGRGASGRTYLATDPGLADRPVVLKVTSDDHREHLALAQLRHTHIVPLFSEHVFADRGLRALCMPDLGGISLARALADLAPLAPRERSGRRIMEAVDRHGRGAGAGAPREGPYRRAIEQSGYVRAVVWIAACLADALQYSHARGLVHMDVKPSNMLLTGDGQPMLLDFHLARAPLAAGEFVLDRIGGTPGWMAPEQERALRAAESGRAVPQAVDGRADLYALGLFLREALVGPGAGPIRRAGRRAAGIGPGLADLVNRCLAPDPADRYPDAATLAADLRRHLQDLPLRGVRNRSPAERLAKWRRRHPAAMAWGATAAAAALALGGFAMLDLQGAGQVRGALDAARLARRAGRVDEAIGTLDAALARSRSLSFPGALGAAIRAERALARRDQLAIELHALADEVRLRHGVELPPEAESRRIVATCRALWEHRHAILAPSGAADPVGPAARDDLVDLVAIWTDLLVRGADPARAAGARREAVARLDAAEALCGPRLALALRRRAWSTDPAAGPAAAPAPAPAPATAWEHHDLGRHLLRAGRFAEARGAFRLAAEARPDDVWSHLYDGLCSYRLGEPAEADAAFTAALALSPRSAAIRHDRALARAGLGRVEAALRDEDRALALDPTLADARQHRGLLAMRLGRHADAIRDFRDALGALPAGSPDRARLLYNLALSYRASGDRDAARGAAAEALRLGLPEAAALAR
jgi:serine/threonine protein kinase/Flp pilus assembly protein TadD